MLTESLLCDSCGAPLQVPTGTNYVTCNHCGTALTVNRSRDVTFTEQLNQIQQSTEELTNQLRELNTHRQLETLDREWQSRQAKHMFTGKNGRLYAPSKAMAIGGGLAVAAFGILWTVMAASITSSGPDFGPFRIAKVVFPMFGLIFVAAALFGSWKAFRMTEAMEQDHREYQRERRRILEADTNTADHQ